jgi:hypothetical protein
VTVQATYDPEIIETVNGFWKAAIIRDKEKLDLYVKLPPKSFYASCVVNRHANSGSNSGEDISFRVENGAGTGTPELSSSYEFVLKFFIEQIGKTRPEIARTVVRKANETQAIVTVDYGSSSASSRADLGLLKIDGIWRIAFAPDPGLLEPVESFGTDKPCKYE